MSSLIYTSALVCIPAFILWLTHHFAWANKIGIIVLCYVAGLLAGNLGLIPAAAAPAQNQVTDLSIALALPLLLFSLDVRAWRHVAGKALLSMLLATTAVVTLATCLFFLFRGDGDTSASHFAAMSVGVYTGGTPNLAAIKAGLDIPHTEYIIFHSLDTLIGTAYLIGMLTLGVPFFRAVLPPAAAANASAEDSTGTTHQMDSDDYSAMLKLSNLPTLATSAALSIAVVAMAWGVSQLYGQLFWANQSAAVLIVTITSLGIGLSLVPRVRKLQLSYKLGMYLIYVFCFAVASMASFSQLGDVDASVAVFLLGTVFGSVCLHGLCCRVFGVDSDTFMVTSVAAVCSPPFVPMMARALGNPATILSGMTTGIIGYALGNYLGISLGLLLQGL